jgi:hypothetical protein
VHADGNPFTAIDSEQIPIVDSVTGIKLKTKISDIVTEYLASDNSSISDWLHNPNIIFHEGQGRHNWTVWIVNSYFWKYGRMA